MGGMEERDTIVFGGGEVKGSGRGDRGAGAAASGGLGVSVGVGGAGADREVGVAVGDGDGAGGTGRAPWGGEGGVPEGGAWEGECRGGAGWRQGLGLLGVWHGTPSSGAARHCQTVTAKHGLCNGSPGHRQQVFLLG